MFLEKKMIITEIKFVEIWISLIVLTLLIWKEIKLYEMKLVMAA